MPRSLCESCGQMREIISGTGSRFLLCQVAVKDKRFPKYPPQPVARCSAYEPRVPPVDGASPASAPTK